MASEVSVSVRSCALYATRSRIRLFALSLVIDPLSPNATPFERTAPHRTAPLSPDDRLPVEENDGPRSAESRVQDQVVANQAVIPVGDRVD